MKKLPNCRLFPIFARESSVCVIFRRGPSKWTQLILWNTETDEITNGQWFKGRIYERRCDLSPDGTKLIYFAQKINRQTLNDSEYTYAWSAISNPPFLTAQALWAKGDCWHGGGLFLDNKTVFLNHKPAVAIPHPKHLPKGLHVIPNREAHGEDEPIFSQRLDRDGWHIVQKWNVAYEGRGFYVTHEPEIREKAYKNGKKIILMERSLNRLKYQENFVVKIEENIVYSVNERGGWIDFDQNGRISFFKDGKLFVEKNKDDNNFDLNEIADFNLNKPETTKSSERAKLL
jgi:hypothetical protein